MKIVHEIYGTTQLAGGSIHKNGYVDEIVMVCTEKRTNHDTKKEVIRIEGDLISVHRALKKLLYLVEGSAAYSVKHGELDPNWKSYEEKQ